MDYSTLKQSVKNQNYYTTKLKHYNFKVISNFLYYFIINEMYTFPKDNLKSFRICSSNKSKKKLL